MSWQYIIDFNLTQTEVVIFSNVFVPLYQKTTTLHHSNVSRFHISKRIRILSIATTFECSYIGRDVALNRVT